MHAMSLYQPTQMLPILLDLIFDLLDFSHSMHPFFNLF
jgi:hypothetical protein